MLGRMKTAGKIGFGFLAVGALMLLLALAAYLGQREVAARLETIATARFPSAQALQQAALGQQQVFRFVNGLLIRGLSASDRRLAQERLAQGEEIVEEGRRAYQAIPRSEGAERLWRATQAPFEAWRQSVKLLADAARERDEAEAGGAANAGAVERAEQRLFTAWYGARKALAALDAPMVELARQNAADLEAERAAAGAAVVTSTRRMALAFLLGVAGLATVWGLLARTVGRNVRGLLGEAGRLTTAVEEGTLDVRGDLAAVSPEFRPVLAGFNLTVEEMARRFRVISECMDRISRGDLPPPITRETRGEFTVTKEAINRCIDAVGRLVADVAALAQAGAQGRLGARADASRHQGDFRKAVEQANALLEGVAAPAQETARVLERLAQRDLTVRAQGSFRGDHARIQEALNATATALHEAIAQVAGAADQLSSASAQIASSSSAVAAGASQQAGALEETSSSLETMTSMTRQAADSAQQANALAQGASSAASEGAAALEQMAAAMGKIKASAQSTSQIIKDINEIAFQTNLLALNAAVEAARAGEAGRGFAVVAEEVRSLALRSKEAASKTEDLIRQSVQEAVEGETTSRRVVERLGQVVGSIGKVTEIVAEISASAKEQAAGIEQVTRAVADMDQVTQQNAASAEESSSASAELAGQSQELAAMVTTFRFERAAGAAAHQLAGEGGSRPVTPACYEGDPRRSLTPWPTSPTSTSTPSTRS